VANDGGRPGTPAGAIRPVPEVVCQALGDEAVLLNLNNGRYYGLDPVGTRMWTLLLDLRDPEAVVRQVMLEYDVDEARCRSDVASLVGRLEQAGLVTRAHDHIEGAEAVPGVPMHSRKEIR
jgi:hypothetical protein